MHLFLVGACYLDTILSVPHYPAEDEKLRATSLQLRRGGNCANAAEVLLHLDVPSSQLRLVSPLPDRGSSAVQTIRESLGLKDVVVSASSSSSDSSSSGSSSSNEDVLQTCLYRKGHTTAASSYIIRSAASSARTIVNYNALPEMTVDEFAAVSDHSPSFSSSSSSSPSSPTWWHFEGRIPETLQACIAHLRQHHAPHAIVSVEVEKPNRPGLRELAAASDVVFYSKTWAEHQGYKDAESCLRGESRKCPRPRLLFCTWGSDAAAALAQPGERVFTHTPTPTSNVVDTVGAGDTFVAGILYQLACCQDHQDPASALPAAPAASAAPDQSNAQLPQNDVVLQKILSFAVELATAKVQTEGFRGLHTTSTKQLQVTGH